VAPEGLLPQGAWRPSTSHSKIIRNHKPFSKIARYKINIQKSKAFLYYNNKKTEKDIREAISFTIASKTIKNLEINLTKETKTFLMKITTTEERN
jgi:hypothetical protein